MRLVFHVVTHKFVLSFCFVSFFSLFFSLSLLRELRFCVSYAARLAGSREQRTGRDARFFFRSIEPSRLIFGMNVRRFARTDFNPGEPGKNCERFSCPRNAPRVFLFSVFSCGRRDLLKKKNKKEEEKKCK